MTKRSKKQKTQPTIAVIIVLIIAVVTAIQQSRQQQGPSMVSTATRAATQMVPATAAPVTQNPAVTSAPLQTRKPLATVDPKLQITPMNGTLYEIVRSVDVLGCPDSRCKVIDTYKKESIIVVTGTVMGTTYKDKKTRVWYQVLFHDGRNVYVHGAFVTPHDVGIAE